MKNLLLFGALLFSLNLYSQTVDYGSQNTTSTCDGYAYLDENSINSSTIADSISVDIPRGGYYALKMLQSYGGKTLTVSDNSILKGTD